MHVAYTKIIPLSIIFVFFFLKESDDLTSADGYSKTRHHPVNISVRHSHDRDPESPLVSETTATYSKLLSEEVHCSSLEQN